MSENKSTIKAFLSQYFQNYDLQDDENIFELGIVNSLFVMELVLFTEKTFNIRIENDDLDIKNFNTINGLTNLVERKSVIV